MDKVYLVITDDVCNYIQTSKFEVFKNYDDAKKYFDSVVTVFKSENTSDLNSAASVVDSSESRGIFTWYEAGNYNENHFDVLIVEKKVH